jgi:hypothetical protein
MQEREGNPDLGDITRRLNALYVHEPSGLDPVLRALQARALANDKFDDAAAVDQSVQDV